MLKKIITTILLLIYFYFIYQSLLFIGYWLGYSVVHNCYISGPSSCQINWTFIIRLSTLTALILSPLNTVIFIKSNKKVKWLLILTPIILLISVYIIYFVIIS